MRQVNEKLMKKTTGGMKRFRPKSREELQNELLDTERAVTRAKRSEAKAQELVKELRQELADAKAGVGSVGGVEEGAAGSVMPPDSKKASSSWRALQVSEWVGRQVSG